MGGHEELRAKIDVASGVNRCAGKRDLYFRMLGKLAATLGDDLPPFAEALALEREDIVRRLHTIKGVAGNLAVNPIFEMSQTVEHAFRETRETEGDYEALRTLCSDMKEVIAEMIADEAIS